MIAKIRHDTALRFIGTNDKGHETTFDTTVAGGGLNSAASPMDILLEAAAACSSMDIVAILQKKRRSIEEFTVDLNAERAESYPKVFTRIEMDFRLVSPDATMKELTTAIELSHTKYCSVSISLARSGCAIDWKATLINPRNQTTEYESSQVIENLPEVQNSSIPL